MNYLFCFIYFLLGFCSIVDATASCNSASMHIVVVEMEESGDKIQSSRDFSALLYKELQRYSFPLNTCPVEKSDVVKSDNEQCYPLKTLERR